ncbi:MAG: hypothetical protein HC882_07445, partial [Acidobacteria bacterium]|nr:hypothetical protein [Acidobacteriota bacterium]
MSTTLHASPLVIERDRLGSFEAASALEWIETDGTWRLVERDAFRRAHAPLPRPARRSDQAPRGARRAAGETRGDGRPRKRAALALSSNAFPGVVHPDGWKRLVRFSRGVFPVFEFDIDGARIEKTVAAIDGEPTRVLTYTLRDASEPITLRLRPFFTCRDVHALGPAMQLDETVHHTGDAVQWRPCPDSPSVFLRAVGGDFERAAYWYRHFQFAIER